ncbi:MAG: hypothetical protein AB1714_06810 [Acidobacteriota bacterium]
MPTLTDNVAPRLREVLAPIVGEFVAKTSLSMAAKKIGKTTETVTLGDIPKLAEALRPALRTLIGAQATESVLKDVSELGGS